MKRLTRMVCVLLATLIFFSTNTFAYAAEKVSVVDVECRFYSTGGVIDVTNQSVPFRIESTKPAKNLSTFSVGFKIDSRINDGDTINLDKKYWNYWSHVNYSVYLYQLNPDGTVNNYSRSRVYYKTNIPIEQYNGMISFNATKDYSNGCYLEMELQSEEVYPDYADATFTAGVDYITYAIEHKTNSLLNNIILQIKEIINNIKEIPTKIGQFFTELAEKITTQFDKLKNNIQTFFNTLGDRISSFFNDLKEKLKALLDELLNFGNNTADYQFSSGLTEVINSLNSYIDRLNDTLVQIDNAKQGVQQYLNQGNEFLNGFLRSTPVAVIAVLVFGVVFIFVRKVVGR